MKRIYNYIGAVASWAVIMAVPSCTDTWEDHYNSGESTAATQSLWKLISENPDLSNFSQIAEQVHYYRDQTHPQADYTFKDMLDGQVMTVWVPENDALSSAEWQKWYDLAESTPYTVQQQFLANSMALWRHIATGGGADTLTMLNGKKQVFDKDNFTMAELPMKEKNIAASNGTLHTMSTAIPFVYNIYEFLKDEDNSTANNLSTFHDLLIEGDTTYFSEDMSIEGLPDANGDPTYVDSVYRTSNTMFTKQGLPSNSNTDQYLTYDESFGAEIDSEDSTFIMLLPTDNAWENAYQMLEKYYNYAPIYVDNSKANNGTTNVYKEVSNTDSLKDKCINMDILSPLCFNLSFQPDENGNIGRWNLDDFMQNYSQARYFLNTYGDTLRTDDDWVKESLFEGDRIEMSNGYGIVSDTWNIPAKLYKPDLYIEVGSSSFYNFGNKSGSATSYSFSNTTAMSWVDSVGRVSQGSFYGFSPDSPSGNPIVEFKLQGTSGDNFESDIMSGKYDIYIVMVPAFYVTSSDSIVGDTLKAKIRATISYCNGDASGRDATIQTDQIEYDGEKVDTLLLFEDFEFPYSYKNMRQCYPTLSLTTKTSATDRRNGYSNTIYVDRFILKSKD
ncbi:MAG: hypothetical protein LUC44_00350 [Prevotellaceae bacterium]|nr:hypothetical protein [Prevotellaceae bacterium]